MEQINDITICKTLILVVLLTLFSNIITVASVHASNNGEALEDTMLNAEKTDLLHLPPIDLHAPADVQTASFGLG